MEQAIRDLERKHEDILARAFRILDERYRALKKVVAVFGILLTLGTVAGIATTRHEASVRAHDTCWSRYNNAVVLKALVNRTSGTFDTQKIHSQELKAILDISAKNGNDFKQFANKNVNVPTCGGNNPHPLSKQIEKLAHTK